MARIGAALAALAGAWLVTGQATAQTSVETAAKAPAAAPRPPHSLGGNAVGYTYFNRPGATLAEHDAALRGCVQTIRRLASQPGNGPGVIGGFVVAELNVGRGAAANLENCMVARGWRVVRILDPEGPRLDTLEPSRLAEVLAPMVGAAQPPGVVVRAWGNDAAVGPTRFPVVPDFQHPSLSARSVGHIPYDASAYTPAPHRPKGTTATPARLGPDTQIPEGMGLVYYRATFPFGGAPAVFFQRIGATPDRSAWSQDGRQDFFGADGGGPKEGKLLAFIAPPGRWRVAGMGDSGDVLDFCLGAPSFEVKAGEAVFAGAFFMGGTDRTPRLDPEVARSTLAVAPQLLPTMRLAEYRNGSTTPCGDIFDEALSARSNFLYAYEVPGAPFEPGYVGGTLAQPR